MKWLTSSCSSHWDYFSFWFEASVRRYMMIVFTYFMNDGVDGIVILTALGTVLTDNGILSVDFLYFWCLSKASFVLVWLDDRRFLTGTFPADAVLALALVGRVVAVVSCCCFLLPRRDGVSMDLDLLCRFLGWFTEEERWWWDCFLTSRGVLLLGLAFWTLNNLNQLLSYYSVRLSLLIHGDHV